MVGNEGFGACGHEPQIQQPAEGGERHGSPALVITQIREPGAGL